MAKDRNPDVEMLYHSAQGFYTVGLQAASEVLKDNKIKGYQILAPAAVNLGFAIELMLKGIILSTTKRQIEGHELLKLYKAVPESTKVQIEARYSNHISLNADGDEIKALKMIVSKGNRPTNSTQQSNDKSLKSVLKRHNQTFDNWRYIYEIGENGYELDIDFRSLHCLIKALVETINAIPRKQRFFIEPKS
jgi:mRNA-degrading endonuclease HigB of HigAB toxin-antitoxin module